MNPTQSLSFLVVLYLLSLHPLVSAIETSNPHHHHHHHRPVAPCGSARSSHNKGMCFRRWCKKALHSKLCRSIVKADHRECWKMSPEGVALILIKAAKANQNRTVTFIRRNLKNATDVGVRQGLENCLFGYGTVGKLLDISICDLSDPESRDERSFPPTASGTNLARFLRF